MKSRCTLKKNSDFRRLYAKGKSTVNPYMVLYCRRNRTGQTRLGYTVSVKLGHAVRRNRIRRRLREMVRLNAERMLSGWDLVLVARARACDAPFQKLQEAYLSSCEKLGLLKKEDA